MSEYTKHPESAIRELIELCSSKPAIADLAREVLDLRAKEMAYAEVLAKAPHHRDCTTNGLVCKNCDKLFREHGIATDGCPDRNSVFEEVRGCNCYLSTLSDPVARGRELLERLEANQRALRVIEETVADDYCEDLDLRHEDLTGDAKILSEKVSKVYRISHSHRNDSVCYAVHDDWRKETELASVTLEPTEYETASMNFRNACAAMQSPVEQDTKEKR